MKYKFNRKNDFLIFVHIPKCGGTTLHSILEKALGDFYLHLSPNNKKDIDDASLRGVGGHQAYGATKYHKIKDRNIRYITILRDPVKRAISFYKHVKRHTEHHLHDLGFNTKYPLDFFKTLYDQGNIEISNFQTRMLSKNHKVKNLSSVRTFKNLKENFSLVGKMENYDSFLEELSYFLDYDITNVRKENTAPELQECEVGNPALKFIKSINKLDIDLYNKLD